MKKPKVLVVIPAANEQENIAAIVNDVLSQKTDNFYLRQIWVVCDASTDDTVSILRAFKSPILKIYAGKKRLGKVARLNKVFDKFNDDVLVQLDADIRLAHSRVLNALVNAVYGKNGADLVFGESFAVLPTTAFEKLSYFGYELWNEAIRLKRYPLRYYSNGQIRAFSKRFVSSFRFPIKDIDISEDTYIYYYAKIHSFKMKIARGAKSYFKLVDNFHDYSKQMKRFLKAPVRMKEYFGEDLAHKYEIITEAIKLKAFFRQALKSPLIAIAYLGLQSFVRIRALSYKPKPAWEISSSSKIFRGQGKNTTISQNNAKT